VERRQRRAALGEEAIVDGEELQRFGRSVAHPVVGTGDGRSYGACDCAFATRARASAKANPSIDGGLLLLMRPPQRVG